MEKKMQINDTVVDAALEQRAVLFEQPELVDGEEGVVDAVRFGRAPRPSRYGHSAQVKIVADRILQLMVHRTFGVPLAQVRMQILG